MPFPYEACNPTTTIAVSVTGNTGMVYVNWTRIDTSGGTNFTVTANHPNYTFGGGFSRLGGVTTQTWRCTVMDDVGTAQEDVVITLERYVEGETPEGPP